MLRGMNPILMMMMAMLLMLTLMLASMEKPQKQMRAKPRVTWEREGDLEKEGWQERMKTTTIMINMAAATFCLHGIPAQPSKLTYTIGLPMDTTRLSTSFFTPTSHAD